MSDTKEVKIKIDDQRYTLKVRSNDEVFYYEKLATYVDETIINIKKKTQVREYKNVLILACLALADEIMCGPQGKVIDNNSIFQEKLLRILEKMKNCPRGESSNPQ